MTPRSTVRLQLNTNFTLAHAAEHVPYYAALGVSHVYLSPISRARIDSTHGYDVIDHRCIDPKLGGEEALQAFVHRAHDHGLGLVLDIVPNHMAAHPDNPWWYSVLQDGPGSPFANWFDIQWNRPELQGKLLLPILGSTYTVALGNGDIRLVHDGSVYGLEVYGLKLPLVASSLQHTHRDDDVRKTLEAYDAATHHGRQRLHDLLQRQHYRLAWWQCAAEQINWRRFFEISDLAGLCVERDDVFDAVHALPLRLFEQGWIDGLRVDHVDGLADPLQYCERLSQALQERVSRRPAGKREERPWLIAEKILAHDEVLDTRWAVDGTTGYDFMEAVNKVMHDAAAEKALDSYWCSIVRDRRPVDEWRREARALMVERHFPSECDTLLENLVQLAAMAPRTRDISRHSLRRALSRFLIEFTVYRTYRRLGERVEGDVRYVEQARVRAADHLQQERDLAALNALDFIADVLKGRSPGCGLNQHDKGDEDPDKVEVLANLLRRFQQLTPPLAAKSLEDTVFYRYGRLLSRNEVGSEPAVFSASVADFHAWNQRRAACDPTSMNATATHDHKRGEDVRARLAVISELPHVWQEVSARCLEALGQHVTIDCGAPAGHCYMVLQTIVGAWPPDLLAHDEASMASFIERLQQWQLKALREAKQRTSWFYPDLSYEQQQADLIEFMLCDPTSVTCRALADFVERIYVAGALNSLAAVVLRCTSPGVPDLYQGTDLWDFSLVDPDNRRPVDLERRAAALKSLDDGQTSPSKLLAEWKSGVVKQALLTRCLRVRQAYPRLFLKGHYTPLQVDGPLASHLIAFSRSVEDLAVIVVVSRLAYRAAQRTGQTLALPLIPADAWADTRITLPAMHRHKSWRNVLTAEDVAPAARMQVKALLSDLPVAVLISA